MALYHKWDVKNGFAYVLTFFSLISAGLGGARPENARANKIPTWSSQRWTNLPIGEYIEKNKKNVFR